MKKYILTNNTRVVEGHTLYQIKAVSAFGDVAIGDLGGWIESEKNLSQEGNAWIYDDAKVFNNARIFGNAKIYDNALIFGNAGVYDNAEVHDYVWVFGTAQICGTAQILSNAQISGDILIWRLNEM